jgi:hypothetical protein
VKAKLNLRVCVGIKGGNGVIEMSRYNIYVKKITCDLETGLVTFDFEHNNSFENNIPSLMMDRGELAEHLLYATKPR